MSAQWRRRGRNVPVFIMAITFFLALLVSGMVALAIYISEASDEKVYEKSGIFIDSGNSDQGYIMVKNTRSKQVVLRVSCGGTDYNYYLSQDVFETFPLQMGDGKYRLLFFEQSSGKKYSQLFSRDVSVKLADENLPFLYPSQYVNYTADSAAVAMSNSLCEGAATDADKFKAISAYITSNILYDHMRALQVKKNDLSKYLPDIDDVLQRKMGICFDYSALAACMLRAQGIPTRMIIGDADKTYHAWNNVLIDGEWVLFDPTGLVTNTKVKSYTEVYRY